MKRWLPLIAAALVAASTHDAAAQSVWEVAKDPRLRRASELLAVAERARIPAEDVLVDPLWPAG
jgi:hypothetical protein